MKRRTFLSLCSVLALAQLPGARALPQIAAGGDDDVIDDQVPPLKLDAEWWIVGIDLAGSRDGCVVAIVDSLNRPVLTMSAPRAHYPYSLRDGPLPVMPSAGPLKLMANMECAAVVHMAKDAGQAKTIADYVALLNGEQTKRELLIAVVNA